MTTSPSTRCHPNQDRRNELRKTDMLNNINYYGVGIVAAGTCGRGLLSPTGVAPLAVGDCLGRLLPAPIVSAAVVVTPLGPIDPPRVSQPSRALRCTYRSRL